MLHVLHMHKKNCHVIAVQMRLQRVERLLLQVREEVTRLRRGVGAVGADGVFGAAHELVTAADVDDEPNVVDLVELLEHGPAMVERVIGGLAVVCARRLRQHDRADAAVASADEQEVVNDQARVGVPDKVLQKYYG
jgi:hypothetical protein